MILNNKTSEYLKTINDDQKMIPYHSNSAPGPSFKLTKLQNIGLRYEVIYKNLLRDLRKFYVNEFNACS